MTVQEYIRSKKVEIFSILSAHGCSSLDRGGGEFLAFLADEIDAIYDIPRQASSLFNVSFEQAEAIDEQLYKTVINPKYDEFVKYNEALRQKQQNKKIVGLQTGKGDMRLDANNVKMLDESSAGRLYPPLPRNDTVNKADFYFSAEDEEEIRQILNHESGIMNHGEEMEKIYSRVAEEVVEKPGIRYQVSGIMPEEEERRNKRLKNIIVARLKDARDVLETKEALTKQWKIGGMEFGSEDAERVSGEIEKARSALQEELKTLRVTSTQSRATRNRDTGSDDASPVTRNAVQDLSVPEIEAPKEAESERGTGNAQREEEKRVTGDRLRVTSPGDPSRVTSGKPAVDSVFSTIPPAFGKQKLTGPVEELASLTLEDFRRLGGTLDVVRKLHDKIELLAADSLLEKKKGIDAWKRCEVYRLYLLMGTESLEKREGVANIVSLRQKQALPVLTLEEFSAIADLNRKISFSS